MTDTLAKMTARNYHTEIGVIFNAFISLRGSFIPIKEVVKCRCT